MTGSFKLKLLLSCLRITCRYFEGDEHQCGVSEKYWCEVSGDSHIACNCDGDINQCDLPEKFQVKV
ncbi:hypothetical protein LCGC14_0574230 [marine sediment metagenome]|uniref:Uncharacterized protein n=1 Tax=marine sediment metagenome TaxID=412755 RepID=A0A0F9URM7_9ZZZZ